jgi:hypothetical protein
LPKTQHNKQTANGQKIAQSGHPVYHVYIKLTFVLGHQQNAKDVKNISANQETF